MEAMTVPLRPSLDGRVARCCSKAPEVPSSRDLAFFEYNGPGSYKAENRCKCGYDKIAHDYFPYYFPGKCKNDYGNLKIDTKGLFRCSTCEGIYYPHELRAIINPTYTPHNFEAVGDTKDTYYCGHSGWD